MRCGRAQAWALCSLVTAGCATASDRMAPEALLGCWYFERETAGEGLRLPWGVRLTDGPLRGWPAVEGLDGIRVASTLTPAGERDFPLGYWRPTAGGDSLQLGHPGGGGLVVDAAVPMARADRPVLEGAARSVGDALQPGQASAPERRPVRLTWARCP